MKEQSLKKINEYYKVGEAADFWGVSNQTLRKWVDTKVVPSVRKPANGYRMLIKSDLEEILWKLKRELKQ